MHQLTSAYSYMYVNAYIFQVLTLFSAIMRKMLRNGFLKKNENKRPNSNSTAATFIDVVLFSHVIMAGVVVVLYIVNNNKNRLSNMNPADIGTKPLGRVEFERKVDIYFLGLDSLFKLDFNEVERPLLVDNDEYD